MRFQAVMSKPKERREIKELPIDKKIYDLYYWEEVLQEEGDGGKVVVCRPKEDVELEPGSPLSPKKKDKMFPFVMKIRSKESLVQRGTDERFRKLQVRMLNFPPHAGVTPIHEVLEDDNFYYIVMERANGGSFFSGLLTEFEDGVMPAKVLRRLLRELLEAVGHVHNQGMLHRDIKPDNLVMQVRPDPSSPTGRSSAVRLIDFDHADPDWSPKTPALHDGYFGTLRFNAPETFMGEFSVASDLYSVGCILYLLMSGQMPYDDEIFDGDEDDEHHLAERRHGWRTEVHQRMAQHPPGFGAASWEAEPLCKDLCGSLLAFDHTQRPQSAECALSHEWFMEGEAAEGA